jgi:hypothetical protein
MQAAIEAVRQRHASSPSFAAASLPFAPLFVGGGAPSAAPFSAALTAELRAASALPSLCSLALLLDVHRAHWLPRAGTVLAALSAAVARAPLKPRGAAAELRLLLRPVRNAARRAGCAGAAELDAAVARLPESTLEGWYDGAPAPGAEAAGGKGKRPREAAAAAAEEEEEEEEKEEEDAAPEEGEEGGELDEATAMELLEGLLDEAEELDDEEGLAEMKRLIAGLRGGGGGGGGVPAQKKKARKEKGGKKKGTK